MVISWGYNEKYLDSYDYGLVNEINHPTCPWKCWQIWGIFRQTLLVSLMVTNCWLPIFILRIIMKHNLPNSSIDTGSIIMIHRYGYLQFNTHLQEDHLKLKHGKCWKEKLKYGGFPSRGGTPSSLDDWFHGKSINGWWLGVPLWLWKPQNRHSPPQKMPH